MAETAGWSVGIDVGGTFVDLVAGADDGRLVWAKQVLADGPTAARVLTALDRFLAEQAIAPAQVTRLLHGTTIATNLLLERKAPPVAVLTTRGFADTLTLGRQNRRALYDRAVPCQTPVALMPAALRFEIGGRIDAAGQEIEPLDEGDVVRAATALRALITDGVAIGGVAIGFLFAHLQSAHERRARDLLTGFLPELAISISSAVDPHPREYERWLTTALDAYVKRVVADYLAALTEGLAQRGLPAPLIMRSSGGLSRVGPVGRDPISLAMSGPAAAVAGVRGLLDGPSRAGAAISLDIGGTTADLSLLESGAARFGQALQLGALSLRLRSVDVTSIALGGGSVARVNQAGGVRLGPGSMGAYPGPAAFGRGGTRSTLLDAALVAGFLPARLAGGLQLDSARARTALTQHVAAPLGLSVEAAAGAVLRVGDAMLAEAVKRVAFASGIDPRDATLVAAGGGGGLHVASVAGLVGARRAVIPAAPGVIAAYGLLASPLVSSAARGVATTLTPESFPALCVAARGLITDARAAADTERDARLTADYPVVTVAVFADASYLGQEFTLEIAFRPDEDDAAALAARFDAAHRKLRGQAFPIACQIHALRAVATAPPRQLPGLPDQMDAAAEAGVTARRLHLCDHLRLDGDGRDDFDCPVRHRGALREGDQGDGPLLIDAPDSTIWIPAGWRWTVGAGGLLALVLTS